jgi:hypothetical protein
MFLRQSTSQVVVIGPVLDADGVAVTSCVVTNFSLAKNGTAAALTTQTLTSLGNGYYSLALTTSNTDTLGIAAIYVNNTTMSMTVFRWNVIVASVYDALVSTATNATGGLLTATGAIATLSGAISTLTAPQVRTELATELGRIDATVSSRATSAQLTTVEGKVDGVKAKTDNLPADPASASDITSLQNNSPTEAY